MDSEGATMSDRAFTVKSVLFGLAGILFVSGLAGFHDEVMNASTLMVGSHLPAGALLFIALIGIVWNGIWGRYHPRLALSTREMVVVTGFTLVACFPPTAGLFRFFQRQLVLPWYYLASGGKPQWEDFNILGYLPSRIFPRPAPVIQDGLPLLDRTVYHGFFVGLARSTRAVSLSEVPFAAWMPALVYWGPLVFLMSVCVMSLSLVVHRQWVRHEQLSYPIAQVTLSFIRRQSGKGIPDVFRSNLFWWGFLPIISLYGLEYCHQWFPEVVPGLQECLPNLKTWRVNLVAKFPIIQKVPPVYLSGQTIYFSVIGLAYFVALEISFTMGVSSVLLAIVGGIFFTVTGAPLSGNDVTIAREGGYIAYAGILLYVGRAYYLEVLRGALGFLRKRTIADAVSVGAARITIVSFIAFVVVLHLMGLGWMPALMFSLLLMLLFLVFTRIICETGIPLMQTQWWPGGLMVSLLGPAALGPSALVFVMYLGTILCQDPRECLMPYVATGFRLADDAGVGLPRLFRGLVVAVALALAVGFISTTWTMYSRGAAGNMRYASMVVPTREFDNAARELSELKQIGQMEESREATGMERVKLISPKGDDVVYMLVGAGIVLVLAGLRLRFSRFPLHPVWLLVTGIYAVRVCWGSFLIGWGIKTLVVKFGGGGVYQKLKPIFIGLIAGELFTVGLVVIFELVYFLLTGRTTDISFNVLVG